VVGRGFIRFFRAIGRGFIRFFRAIGRGFIRLFRVVGRGFIRLFRVVGRGFIPGTKPIKNVSGFSPCGMSFVKRHDFSDADEANRMPRALQAAGKLARAVGNKPIKMTWTLALAPATARWKALFRRRRVKGHDFSRAINPQQTMPGFSPGGNVPTSCTDRYPRFDPEFVYMSA
jgi:hypothetical protein